MKATLISATLVACLLAIVAVTNLQGQQNGPAAPPRNGVAVIDIGYIFKNYTVFTAQMNRLKADVDAAEGQLKKQRDDAQKIVEEMKGLKPGSIDYKKREEQVTQLEAKFNVDMSLQKKDFMDREGKVYHAVYQSIADEVRYFSQKNAISVVLRTNSDPIDPVPRAGSTERAITGHIDFLQVRNGAVHVLDYKPDAGINKPIVFAAGNDITQPILDSLNQRAANPANAMRQGVRPGTK